MDEVKRERSSRAASPLLSSPRQDNVGSPAKSANLRTAVNTSSTPGIVESVGSRVKASDTPPGSTADYQGGDVACAKATSSGPFNAGGLIGVPHKPLDPPLGKWRVIFDNASSSSDDEGHDENEGEASAPAGSAAVVEDAARSSETSAGPTKIRIVFDGKIYARWEKRPTTKK